MFLFLSKTLDWLLSPLSWVVVLTTLGFLLWRRRRWALALIGAGFAVLLLFSTQLVAAALTRWVESGAVDTSRPITYDAVIVLGGGLDPDSTLASGRPEYNEASERLLRGFELMRAGRARYVLLSAGNLHLAPGERPEALVLAGQLIEWGIEPNRIVAETASRNTRENAIESEKVVRAAGWKSLLLVTSAAHLPRALGCFRAVGLEPDTLPVDFRRVQGGRSLEPRAGNLAASADALRELFGRLVYRVMGYSKG